jgi:hypothetical protein
LQKHFTYFKPNFEINNPDPVKFEKYDEKKEKVSSGL